MCITIKTDAAQGAGNAAMMRRSGSSPPAEAAITTMAFMMTVNAFECCAVCTHAVLVARGLA
jgi:hypothetical protein